MSASRTGAARPGTTPNSARRLTADERRRQLFTVALNLFAERGFRSTTMDDIAEAAGVTKPLVYQHFSSKRALYLELVDSVAKELVAAIGSAVGNASGPRQQVEMGFAAYFDMVVTHEAAFRLLYGRNYDDDLGEALGRVEDAIAAAIEPLITAGLDDGHRRFLAHAVVGMAEGASRCWITGRGGPAPHGDAHRSETGRGDDPVAQRLASRLADLAWAGLRSVHAD